MGAQASGGEATSSTTGVEPIVKSGSSADMVTFDELESFEQPAPKSKPGKKVAESDDSEEDRASRAKPSKGKKKASEDEEVEDGSEKGEDDDGKGTKETTKEQQKTKGQVDKEKTESSVRSLKVRSGDQDIDLRSDAQLEVKVAGKIEKVSVDDLMKNYSGKTDWSKKYQELDTEKKSFQNEKQDLQSGIDKLLDLSKNDPLAAVEYLYDTLGENAREHIKKLREQIYKAFEEWSQLSPEERKQREIQEEGDYHKKRADRLESDRLKAQEKATLETRVSGVKQKYNLDDASFVSRYDELKQLKSSGQIEGDITPELIGRYHQQMTRQDQVEAALNEINPELEGKDSAFRDLMQIWNQDDSLTIAQVKAIATEVYGSDAAKKLAKKIQKSGGPAAVAPPKPKVSKREPVFFDDLD